MKNTSAVTGQTSFVIKELEGVIRKGNAHASFDEAVKGIKPDLVGVVPDGLPYSLWQLIEHIRIAQWDILGFSRDPLHKSPKWPDEYWPKQPAPSDFGDVKKSIELVAADRNAFIGLMQQAGEEIYTPFEHGDGQSLFREALLIADHTSYHTGEIIILRRLLKDWE
jgi:DinB family protein